MALTRPALLLLLLPAAAWVLWLGRPSRGPGRRRELASLIVRLLLVLLLVLGLAGAQIVRQSDDLSVVFLLDFSDSVGQAGRAAEIATVQQALAAARPNDRAGIVVFGEDAVVDRPVSPGSQLGEISSVVRGRATDLAEAIRLGLALFPAGSARRLVLISDGAQTVHALEAEDAARLAAATGVRLDVVPLVRASGPEALVADVRVPPRLHQGEDFDLRVTVQANADMSAGLRAFMGGVLVSEQTVRLGRGSDSFVLRLKAGTPGFVPFRVQIEPETDTYFQNNSLSAFSQVTGPPGVLLVAADTRESAALGQALAGAGLDVTTVEPPGLPSDLAGLSRYASVVLVDTPAQSLSNHQMAVLQSYVRDLGGGLVAVGGPHAYGMGGWFRTPIEETLPVDMQVKDPKRFPAIAFAVVIDESGSMGVNESGIPKFRLADEAAARVAEMLHDFDEITVIGFDTQPTTVIGPVPGTEKEAAIPKIMSIGPGGGGIYIHDSLVFARDLLLKSDKPSRHIILLADGSDSEQQEGAREVAEKLKDANITLTTVAIGSGQDVPFLQDLAKLGGGRFHFTDRAANLPKIFAQEAAEVQRSYLVEEPFSVRQISASPILQDIAAAPQLLGYVATSAKPAAQTVLVSHKDDPVLAQWQYGLGRAVAFTSDATGRWGAQWVTWEHFARFWAQAVRWTIREDTQQTLEPSVQYDGERAVLDVEALDGAGTTMNGMSLTLRLVAPSLAVEQITLPQVGPGQYRGEFVPAEEGAYLLGLSGTRPDGRTVVQASGWVNPYSSEYRLLGETGEGMAALSTLATLTGGGVLAQPASAFAHNLPSERAAQDVWVWLLTAATVLLPIDIGVRRLVVTRYEIRKALARAGQALRSAGLQRPVPKREPTLARLFSAKSRVERARAAPTTPPPSVTESPAAPAPTPPGSPPTAPAAPQPPGTPPAPGVQGDTLASKLLRKKRGRE